MPMDFKDTWDEMEVCVDSGMTRAIRVSNFSIAKIEKLMMTVRILPAVNQVEIHPYCNQKSLITSCRSKGILVISYASLGALGNRSGTDKVIQSNLLAKIAADKGKSPAQVALRWAFQQWIWFLAKGYQEHHMKENITIFDWELTDVELKAINEFPHVRVCKDGSYIFVYRPFAGLKDPSIVTVDEFYLEGNLVVRPEPTSPSVVFCVWKSLFGSISMSPPGLDSVAAKSCYSFLAKYSR
ncbi:OLC1v1013688C1 [Oldenlandia corymbosa var. corymbosa]|uniref:OLC1v1013688C1 n=1 Tax=Oldenlandia corymbosa var. corymbosa TaxID=529605 RepID=A0AAV1DZB6_OLDCO|nr:OLC1v1013688C1 [Oldenlandia corymbosa var. corymbosa]